MNFSKANCDRFTALSEHEFRTLPTPTSANIGEKNIRKEQRRTSGRIPEIRPNFPTEAALLAEERDEIRKQDPSDARIKELTYEVNSIVKPN